MGQNWAIAIGINGYDYMPKLQYAQQDAIALRAYFQQDLKFQQVYYFSDNSPPISQDYGPDLDSKPTFAALRRFLRIRFEQAFLSPGDNLWFFFAGHGARHEDRDYLMPIDADPGDIPNTAIPLNYVIERLRRCGADNVILLIDACRNRGGRDIRGIGEERQQGVITLFSCSPNEISYEITELQQGAFTYALLQALRLQGEGNCATVERLYHRLRYEVPQLMQRYGRPKQTPYGMVEPPSKYHLILLPQRATLQDVETLKNDALKAEINQVYDLANQLWIRVLAVSPADPDAIEAIRRLSPSSPKPNQPTHIGSSTGSRQVPLPPLTRRRAIQLLGYTSAGIGTAFLGKQLFQRETPVTNPDPPTNSTSPSPSPIQLSSFGFEVATVNPQGEILTREPHQAQQFIEDLGNNIPLEMVAIPAGQFVMGSPNDEIDRSEDEGPQREVSVPAFWMGKYPVTQAQWRAIAALDKIERDLDPNPSAFKGSNRPVEMLSWHDAVEGCKRLSHYSRRTYRFPSEAEWEYACRAGTTTPFHFGETITTNLVNYNGNFTYGLSSKGSFRQETTSVGSFKVANSFGLYDMHGNVWEWCLDLWHENYYGAPVDGSAWWMDGDGRYRLLRGGSWYDVPKDCRSAYRLRIDPNQQENNFGLRLVCLSARAL
jgi:formylglycine-generating enzyme required for sulfatase activity/uncharacterized caspase-like protein